MPRTGARCQTGAASPAVDPRALRPQGRAKSTACRRPQSRPREGRVRLSCAFGPKKKRAPAALSALDIGQGHGIQQTPKLLVFWVRVEKHVKGSGCPGHRTRTSNSTEAKGAEPRPGRRAGAAGAPLLEDRMERSTSKIGRDHSMEILFSAAADDILKATSCPAYGDRRACLLDPGVVGSGSGGREAVQSAVSGPLSPSFGYSTPAPDASSLRVSCALRRRRPRDRHEDRL